MVFQSRVYITLEKVVFHIDVNILTRFNILRSIKSFSGTAGGGSTLQQVSEIVDGAIFCLLGMWPVAVLSLMEVLLVSGLEPNRGM